MSLASGPCVAVRREKARIFSGCESRPDDWSLHPVWLVSGPMLLGPLLGHSFGVAPLPVLDFRHVHAVSVDVPLVLDELVLKLLLEIGPLGTGLRHAIDRIHHQVEAIHVIHDRHVEGRRDRALFLVASDVQVAVGSAVRQPVDQPGVSVEGEDDVFVSS